ncbi:MAG: sugar nucleotide-binding protein [Nanoarchaeota archaeon]
MGKTTVFGAGFLGTRISNSLGYELVGKGTVDPTNLKDLSSFLDETKPSVVINAVGKTGKPNIDWCEKHQEETLQSNVVAAINLSTECALRRIYFVHLSSGCMYQGDNGGKGFTEDDEPNFYGPQFYAKTKILAERALKELPGLILRLRMPIDDSPHERNLIDKLKKYPNLIDIPNSMTTVPHAIAVLKEMIDGRLQGVYNFVNPGKITASEIMGMYQEIVDSSHSFGLLSLEGLNQITVAGRSNCYLNTDKLSSEGRILPSIHEAVKDCLIKYKENLK